MGYKARAFLLEFSFRQLSGIELRDWIDPLSKTEQAFEVTGTFTGLPFDIFVSTSLEDNWAFVHPEMNIRSSFAHPHVFLLLNRISLVKYFPCCFLLMMSEITFLGSPLKGEVAGNFFSYLFVILSFFWLLELNLTLMLLLLYVNMIIYAIGVLYWMLSTVDI